MVESPNSEERRVDICLAIVSSNEIVEPPEKLFKRVFLSLRPLQFLGV